MVETIGLLRKLESGLFEVSGPIAVFFNYVSAACRSKVGGQMNRHAVPNAIASLPGRPVNGGSSPRFYDFDDGVVRLVKWHPCPHGVKGCVNELVASRLGLLIDSPILRGSVAYVPDDIIPADHRPIAQAGFHFAVARMQGQNFMPSTHYSEIENSAQLAAAAVHLTWLKVEDQQGHNQFLQRLETGPLAGSRTTAPKVFRLIDMGFMFASPSWSIQSLAALPRDYDLPVHLAEKVSIDALDAAIAQLSGVADEDIRKCFADVPDEWGFDNSDAVAAADLTIARRSIVREIILNRHPDIANRH